MSWAWRKKRGVEGKVFLHADGGDGAGEFEGFLPYLLRIM